MKQLRRAFTLLELILALAIGATLAAALYASFNTAIRARKTALNAVEPLRYVSIAADIIARDVGSTTYASGTFSSTFIGIHQAGQTGDNDGVQFHSIGADEPLRDEPLADGIRRVEYVVRTDLNPPALVRHITRNLQPANGNEANIQEEIICRDVKSFSLRYYDGLSWVESWDSTQYDDIIPVAVAMTLELIDPAATSPDQPSPRRITRIFQLACSRPEDLMSQVTNSQ